MIALGSYSVAAITPVIVADYRDARLSEGKSVSTVRLELALLGHLFTVAIKEWGLGLPMNPVSLIRRPSPGQGRNRRLLNDEEFRLLTECDAHSNPMLGWIVRIASTFAWICALIRLKPLDRLILFQPIVIRLHA